MSSANTLAILRKARELISTPEQWTKGSWGRDAEGQSVGVHLDEATCFCLQGAIIGAASTVTDHGAVLTAHKLIKSALPVSHGVTTFNDDENTTHEDVLGVLDRAIEKASI